MGKITPSHQAHENLVADVERWLHDQGFYTRSLAYHDVLGNDTPEAKRLALMWDPSAITMRHRPDRIAFHQTLPFAFWWEAKTKGDKFTRSETINVDLCTLIATWSPDPDLRTLFVHRNQHTGSEVGFWVHGVPRLSQDVRISRAKWGDTPIAGWYKKQATRIFGKGVSIIDHKGWGSGDPYVSIAPQVAQALPNWRVLVTEAMQITSAPVVPVAQPTTDEHEAYMRSLVASAPY